MPRVAAEAISFSLTVKPVNLPSVCTTSTATCLSLATVVVPTVASRALTALSIELATEPSTSLPLFNIAISDCICAEPVLSFAIQSATSFSVSKSSGALATTFATASDAAL